MSPKDFLRIGTSTAAGAIAYAALPVALLTFWIFLAQDNIASDEDVSGLIKAAIFFLGIGALIGLIVSIVHMRTGRAVLFALFVTLVLIAVGLMLEKADITDNSIAGSIVFGAVPSILAGIASGYSNRKLTFLYEEVN